MRHLSVLLVVVCFAEGAGAQEARPGQQVVSDEALLNLVERRTFDYFWSGAEENSQAALERIHIDDPTRDAHTVTSGGTGFGLMALLAGIEFEWVNRAEATQRLERVLEFLQNAERFHGAWSHWIDGRSGQAIPFSRIDDGGDLVETAFLAQGLLCVRQYFANGDAREQKLAELADQLWKEIEWNWYLGDPQADVLLWHWSKKFGFELNMGIEGYNECLVTYVLAASSPSYPIEAEVYHRGWAANGEIRRQHQQFGFQLELKHQGIAQNAGPLFWSQYSYVGLDPRNLKDRYADYWKENVAHVRMVHAYCKQNPQAHQGYSELGWGMTASYAWPDGSYAAHCPAVDQGTLSPAASVGSIAYAPDLAIPTIRHFYDAYGDRLLGKYGFYDCFNLNHDYFPKKYLANNQGPSLIMLINHRHDGFMWRLFMSAPEVRAGLKKLDFEF